MINIESMVFTAIYNAVMTKAPNAYVTSKADNIPPSFPCVSVAEIDNYTYTRTQDDSLKEHHATVSYEVDVYSTLDDGNKEEAREIMGIVDEAMQELKFTRLSMMRTPTLDRTKYRLTARYRAVVEEPKLIDGKTIYQMYRR